MAMWTGSYKSCHTENTPGRGAVSIAISGTSVWFKRSLDGVTWPADGAAVLVGTLGTTNKICHIRRLPNGWLLVTNGYDKTWQSKKLGRAESWDLI